MKPKTAVILLVASGIINICLIVIYFIYVSDKFLLKPVTPTKTYFFRSDGIKSKVADSLIKGYKNSKYILKTLRKNQQADLFEFCFGADQIDEIINHNGSNVTAIDQVAIYFSFESPYNSTLTPVRHLIAYGMIGPYDPPIAHTGGKLLDYFSGTSGHASIFESEVPSFVSKVPAEQSRQYYYTPGKNDAPISTFDYDDIGKELDGFSFNASQIDQILSVEHPDTVAFAIGLTYPKLSKVRWHIIAYGKKNGSPVNLNPSAVIAPGKLPATALYFDKADPCPKCVPK